MAVQNKSRQRKQNRSIRRDDRKHAKSRLLTDLRKQQILFEVQSQQKQSAGKVIGTGTGTEFSFVDELPEGLFFRPQWHMPTQLFHLRLSSRVSKAVGILLLIQFLAYIQCAAGENVVGSDAVNDQANSTEALIKFEQLVGKHSQLMHAIENSKMEAAKLLPKEHSLNKIAEQERTLEKGISKLQLDAPKALARYIVNDDIDKLNNLLDIGIDPNTVIPDSVSILCSAAAYGRKEIVELLLSRGANPNLDQGNTPLQMAIVNEHTEIVIALLVAGANPNQSVDNLSPLLKAVSEKDYKIVEWLLKYKANPNIVTIKGEHPLADAVYRGDVEMATLLLKNGANPFYKDHEKKFNIFDVVLVDENEQLIKAFLDNGVSPHYKHEGEIPAIVITANKGKTIAVSVLLAAGADPNQRFGQLSVLEYATTNGHLEVIELLLQYGATEIQKALAAAIVRRNLDAVRLLLEKGANPNEHPTDTPLLRAIDVEDKDIVTLLLENGADLHLIVGRNCPLGHAIKKNNLEMVQLLIKHGVDVSQPAFTLPEIIPIEHLGKSVNEIDSSKWEEYQLEGLANFYRRTNLTAIIFAVQLGNKDIIESLLKAGANPRELYNGRWLHSLTENQELKDMISKYADHDPTGYVMDDFIERQQKKFGKRPTSLSVDLRHELTKLESNEKLRGLFGSINAYHSMLSSAGLAYSRLQIVYLGQLIKAMVEHDCGVEPSLIVSLAREAAARGSLMAVTALGVITMQGNGVPRDIDAALKWWKLGERYNYHSSMSHLVEYHLKFTSNSKENPADPEKAIELLERLVDLKPDFAKHQLYLGEALWEIRKDAERAKIHLEIAKYLGEDVTPVLFEVNDSQINHNFISRLLWRHTTVGNLPPSHFTIVLFSLSVGVIAILLYPLIKNKINMYIMRNEKKRVQRLLQYKKSKGS